jgi:integrase/recombinase XerD
MASIKWKGITRDVDARGNVRWYFRSSGKPKVRLHGEPGSEAFALAYFAARNGEPAPATHRTGPARGTFAYIVRHYLTSRDFKALDRKLTQRPRELLLETLVEKIGHLPAMIDPMTIRQGVKDRTYAQGKDFLAALRAVYRLACDDGLVPSDPTAGIRRKPNVTEGHRTWTAEDCAAYEKRWPLGTQARTAYAIGLYTAQRISDAVKIGRPHERDGRLRFTQAKNAGRRPVVIDVPIAPPLRAALDAWQGKGLTYLETAYGQPFATGKGLQNKFREWCREAGVHPDCSFHGLRKATAARMAEAGCTPHQIMAVLGHSTHQQAATYTAKAQRAGLADDAMGATFGAFVPAQKPVGTNAEKAPLTQGLKRPLAVPRGRDKAC